MSDIPGLGEGIEAIRVLMQGTEIFLRLSGHAAGWTVDRIARAVVLLAHHMEKKKSEMKEGEVNFRDLITKDNKGVSMMQIENDHFDDFKKYAKDMGLSYSIMPDINKNDIYMEIAFPEEQGEAFRYFISQNPQFAKNYTYGEYFDNANPVDMEKEIKGFGKEAVQFAAELKEKEKQATETIPLPLDTSLLENSGIEGQKLLAVPNTENCYIRIPDTEITEQDGMYMLHLAPNEPYQLYDHAETVLEKDGEPMTISGTEYASAFANMDRNTEINLKKREAAKETVKFVRQDEAGKVQERILKSKEKPPVEELEELLERAKGKGR